MSSYLKRYAQHINKKSEPEEPQQAPAFIYHTPTLYHTLYHKPGRFIPKQSEEPFLASTEAPIEQNSLYHPLFTPFRMSNSLFGSHPALGLAPSSAAGGTGAATFGSSYAGEHGAVSAPSTASEAPLPNWRDQAQSTGGNNVHSYARPTNNIPTEDVYCKDVPLELREANKGSSVVETLNVKISVVGSQADPEEYRIELTSEEDIFFHYQTSINVFTFRAIQSRQNLTVDFHQFVSILQEIFDHCIEEVDRCRAVFVFRPEGHAKLLFLQDLGYKNIDLLYLDFKASNQDLIREHVRNRYRNLKIKYQASKSSLTEIRHVVKTKNPGLLLYLSEKHGDGLAGRPSSRHGPTTSALRHMGTTLTAPTKLQDRLRDRASNREEIEVAEKMSTTAARKKLLLSFPKNLFNN